MINGSGTPLVINDHLLDASNISTSHLVTSLVLWYTSSKGVV